MTDQIAHVRELTRNLTDEIMRAMGLSSRGWARRLLGPLFWPPAHRFAKLAAAFDRRAAECGLQDAASWILPKFVPGVEAHGQEVIPREGPLLIASNHPGTVDGLAIISQVPRDDVKVVVTGIPFTQGLPGLRDHLIYTPREGSGRMTTVRETIRHLRAGGALLIFPGGNVEPDPALLPGAAEAMKKWSRSLELILHQLPDTQVLLTIVSGVLSPRWLHNPFTRFRHGKRERQVLAEFGQIIQQMVFGIKSSRIPHISFAQPITAAELRKAAGADGLLAAVIESAQRLLAEHLAQVGQQTEYELQG